MLFKTCLYLQSYRLNLIKFFNINAYNKLRMYANNVSISCKDNIAKE